MGNTPPRPNLKLKQRRSIIEEEEEGEEEYEYEEVEVEVEEEESEVQEGLREQARRKTSNAPTFGEPQDVKMYKLAAAQKSIKSSVSFVRHYESLLHRFHVSPTLSGEETWLTNLDSNEVGQRAQPNNQVVRENIVIEDHIHKSQGHFKETFNKTINIQVDDGSSGRYRSEKGPTSFNSNMSSQISPYNDKPKQSHKEFPSRSENSNLQLPNPFPSRVPSGNNVKDDSRNMDSRSGGSRLGVGTHEEEADGEQDFIKTAFRRSEANSESFDEMANLEDRQNQDVTRFSQTRTYREKKENTILNPVHEEDEDDLEVNFGQKTARSFINQNMDSSHQENSIKDIIAERNRFIENNKLQMYENYLEHVLAEKPSKVQKLLVQKYYEKHGDENSRNSTINNRISTHTRTKHRMSGQPLKEDSESLIVKNLKNNLERRLPNPEPALLTECGVKTIKDKRGNDVSLKLIKFIKDKPYATPTSVNTKSGNYNTQNKDIVYLSDKYQMKNLLEKTVSKPKRVVKDYSAVKPESLWPKGAKVGRKGMAPRFGMSEFGRLSQEVDEVRHSLNYAKAKHHPKNINFNQAAECASPKWGSFTKEEPKSPPRTNIDRVGLLSQRSQLPDPMQGSLSPIPHRSPDATPVKTESKGISQSQMQDIVRKALAR